MTHFNSYHNMKRILFIYIISLVTFSLQAQILLGSRRAVLDSLTGNWLCSVPENTFGDNFSATIHYPETWTQVTINGEPVTNGTNYTFNQVSGENKYAISVLTEDSLNINGNICFTFYPIFELTGTFNDDYQITDIIANMPQNQSPTTMFSKVKHRGGVTNKDPREKRNYHIKFINADSTKMDRQFFGLRNDNSWLLDAGQIDMLRIRNRVVTELWMDMVSKPYYASQEPKALLGVRGDFIEVFLNGKYHGIFALTEAMDRKQMKLAKYDETNSTFHGMLWKTKTSDRITNMTSYYGYNNNNETWGGHEVKYPDPDDVLPTDWKILYDATKFVAQSDNTEFCQQVGDYFDIPVLIDYWILINASLAVDNGVKNIYWAVYDQTQDKKITLAAWDLDCTFGQNWINYPLHNESVVGPTRNINTFNKLLLRLHERNPEDFAVKSSDRYHELRQTLLNEDSLINRFRNRLEPLYRSGAIERETNRWSRVYDLSGQVLNFDSEMLYIENWIKQRMTFLDNGRFSNYIMGDSNRDGVVDVTDLNRIINLILNNDYPMWYEDMNNDYIIDVSDINRVINIILSDTSDE